MLHRAAAAVNIGGKAAHKRTAITALLLAICLCMPCGAALATTDELEPVSMEDASGALLVEASTQQVLMEQEADTARTVAGLSKLPAILVLCEAVDEGMLDLTSKVKVSQRASKVGGPTAFIDYDEVIAAAPLMKAAVMISAGDAILALGETLCGTESAFADRIRARLNELEIDAEYADVTGKDVQLSPRQLAVLGAELMESTCFAAHSKLTLENFTHSDGRETELVNANRMLRNYAGCTGVSTGSSQTDGYCGVFSVIRGDTHLICVVLGCKNASTRFALAGDMLDQAFATKKAQKLASEGDVIAESVRVQGGTRREVNLVAKDTVVLLLEKSESALTPVENIPERLDAPLNTETVLGTISYQTSDGVEKGKVELVAQFAVEQAFFRDIIRQILLGFLRS